MPNNPWLAIDGTTSPSHRARELRRVWDEFVGNGRLDAARAPIAQSWQRSRVAGVDPSASRAPTVIPDRTDVALRWHLHPLEAAAPLIRKWLGKVADETDQLIVVSDAAGMLLWLDGDARVRSAAADAMNFVEGSLWSEDGPGTNAIGTALAADHPVQVHAAEHFSEVVHAWTCSAAPVHDPESGRLLGIIDLTGRMRTANAQTLPAVVAAARAVEADLRGRMQARDARFRRAHLSGRGPQSLVSPTGRVIADDPEGLLQVGRLELPPDGGRIVLPSGIVAIAERVRDEEAFIVRPLHGSSGRRSESRSATPDAHEWRRTQVELSKLAEEQAALRRVATLVAGHAASEEIFESVAEEVARILHADRSAVARYEADESMTVQAYWSGDGSVIPAGTRLPIQSDSATAAVWQAGRPVRIDDHDVPRSTVGAPIVVDGRVWGSIVVTSLTTEPFPADAESRVMAFTELAATAISNAVVRAELAASRARVVVAADESRRRIERNLHDGLQQRLVSVLLELRAVRETAPERPELLAEVFRIEGELGAALEELREVSSGIHPAILSNGGLAPALHTLARRSSVPVELDVTLDSRLPEAVEVAAYYVVSEALTNAAKHARASLAHVALARRNGSLLVSVRDDGAGGADPERGSGLIGLRDRVEAIGGSLTVESPLGAGTSLHVSLPVRAAA